jgi:aminopeptidase N
LRFRERRERSAYLFGFAAGRFERVALPGRAPSLFVLTDKSQAANVPQMFADTRSMLRFFEETAGVRFNEASYTQVLIPGDEAQEAVSHSTIGVDAIAPILADRQEDWAVAHELAHQWWGNSLTCADWSELWLNEGLTVFMVAAYKEQRWGRAAYERELELANKRWKAAKEQGFDVPLSWKGTYPSLKLKRAMAYAKAVVFLDLLRKELGEEAFWRAIKAYTRAHRESVVTASDLQRAMEQAAGRNLAGLFATWVFGPS